MARVMTRSTPQQDASDPITRRASELRTGAEARRRPNVEDGGGRFPNNR
jgi:hypothetical protein